MLASDVTLRITEIFCSLQGESSLAGERTTFVRLTGCPLRCVYCDSAYAFQGGEIQTLVEVVATVEQLGAKHVCVTGGEPLAQPGCINLLAVLCDRGYNVSLETSGAMDIAEVDHRIKRVVDLKTPSSGEVEKNRYQNVGLLTKNDELKFVLADRADYDWACEQIIHYDLHDKVGHLLFSPAFSVGNEFEEGLQPLQLAEWIIEDKLPVRFQLQLHKLLWGDKPGH